MLEHAYNCAFLNDGDVVVVGVPVIGKPDDMASFYLEDKLLLVININNAFQKRLYKEAGAIAFHISKNHPFLFLYQSSCPYW